MELLSQILIAITVSVAMSLIAYKLNMLTKSGTLASIFTGSIVGIFGTLEWFILLMTFTISGLVATKIDFDRKVKKGVQEGKHGERTHQNVLGVGLPPCIIAILFWAFNGQYEFEFTIALVSTMAVATADTIASEIGTKDDRVWLITNFKRVKPGVDGGVSILGTLTSSIASLTLSIIGWLMIYHTVNVYVLIPTFAGIAGNVLDSIIGATIETKGYISKYTNNFSTALMGASIGVIICLIV